MHLKKSNLQITVNLNLIYGQKDLLLKVQRDRNLYNGILVFSKVNTTINGTLSLNHDGLSGISLQLLQQVLVKCNSRYKQINSQTDVMRKPVIKTLRKAKKISKFISKMKLPPSFRCFD